MKTLSLKLDDHIFNDTEKITARLHVARNRYINDAVKIYNYVNKKRSLKSQLIHESKLTRKDSMTILAEFEKFLDADKAI